MKRLVRLLVHVFFTINALITIPVGGMLLYADGTTSEKMNWVVAEVTRILNSSDFFLVKWIADLHRWNLSLTMTVPWLRFVMILFGAFMIVVNWIWLRRRSIFVRRRRSDSTP